MGVGAGEGAGGIMGYGFERVVWEGEGEREMALKESKLKR